MNNIPKVLLAADNDRDMLEYLHEAFQSQVNVCDQCGHEEPTSTCDSASDLKDYLSNFQTPPKTVYSEAKERELCKKDWLNTWTKTDSSFELYLEGWLACAQSRAKAGEDV